MRLATYLIHNLGLGGGFPLDEIPGTFARFGDEVLVYTSGSEWQVLNERAEVAGIELRELPWDFEKEELYLVVQVGDSFRREHPEATIILNKGRYLAVALGPEHARPLLIEQSCRYMMRPLKGREVIFDLRLPVAQRAKPKDYVTDLVAQVSRQRVEAVVKYLASFPTRHSTSANYSTAAIWARDQLAAMDYRVRLKEITVGDGKSFNVIAEKQGRSAGERGIVIVTAHLDSINIDGGPSAPAPGADDNGSGSAGLLEIARVLREHAGEGDLRFVLFGGEEEGLRGSQQYVATLSESERQRIKAVVNMDMIATVNTGGPLAVLLEGAPISQQVINGLDAAAASHTQLAVQKSLHPANSDHVPFIIAGVPAVLTIEGTDRENHNIHSERDTLEHINFDLLLDILRMNLAFVASTLGRQGGMPMSNHNILDET